MFDGGSGGGIPGGIKGAVLEATPVVQEVAKDFQDSVGQAIEAGVQAVVGSYSDPQQIQKNEQDRQKKLQEIRWQIQQMNKTESEIEKVRREKEEKEKQRLHAQVQKEQQAKQIKMQQSGPRVDPALANLTAGRAEIKKGVGG